MNRLKPYAKHLPSHLLDLLAAVRHNRKQAKNYQRSIGYSAPVYCEGDHIPSSLTQEASALVSKAADLLNETYLLCNLPARNVRPSPTLDGINVELDAQQKYLKRLTNHRNIQSVLANIWLEHNGILHHLTLKVTADCDDGIRVNGKTIYASNHSPQTPDWLETLSKDELLQLEDICMLHTRANDNLYVRTGDLSSCLDLKRVDFHIETESTDGDMGNGIREKARG